MVARVHVSLDNNLLCQYCGCAKVLQDIAKKFVWCLVTS